MRSAGQASWSISVDQWNPQLEWALWFRAAERIEVPAGGMVTGPPDVDPLPERSAASADELVEGWLWWWRAVLAQPPLTSFPPPPGVADPSRFSPPDFEGLAGHPTLRHVVTARWDEANAWHSTRKRAGVEAFRATRSAGPGREGAAVRAVEAEIGHRSAPFSVRIIVLPVVDHQIRSAGKSTFLVPERVHASSAYDDWLRKVVRALA
ncbi:hypothetical protein [Lentzea sp.]|uniref:hypothetical protein n=1 Tax=Lentzea sp. TaxID=56099 RepID=UPI002BDCE942|nr:hypothetical protein [Lentzea sp.]HUQ59375.1 hypothetical protein [Lentzea sp.]